MSCDSLSQPSQLPKKRVKKSEIVSEKYQYMPHSNDKLEDVVGRMFIQAQRLTDEKRGEGGGGGGVVVRA